MVPKFVFNEKKMKIFHVTAAVIWVDAANKPVGTIGRATIFSRRWLEKRILLINILTRLIIVEQVSKLH